MAFRVWMAAMMSRALVFSPLAMGELRGACCVPESENAMGSVDDGVVAAGGGLSFVSWDFGSLPAVEGSGGRSKSDRDRLRDDFTRATNDGG
jgi:hypothetical protein